MTRTTSSPVIAAAEFLAAGGRLMISPHGRLEPAIDAALLCIDTPVAAGRRSLASDLMQLCRRRGSTLRLKNFVRRHGRLVNGWKVMEATAQDRISVISRLEVELDALIADKAKLDPYGGDQDAWEAVWTRQDDLLRRVEALPQAPANAVVRAKAIVVIHLGDDEETEADMCETATDQRLMVLMKRDLCPVRATPTLAGERR